MAIALEQRARLDCDIMQGHNDRQFVAILVDGHGVRDQCFGRSLVVFARAFLDMQDGDERDGLTAEDKRSQGIPYPAFRGGDDEAGRRLAFIECVG